MPNDIRRGQPAPLFDLPAGDGGRARLADFKGRQVVLYFYPKDDTPGCTREAVDFSGQREAFEAAGAVIVGISKDSVAKHGKFAAKHGIRISLGSDEAGTTCEDYGVWVEKSMYGKTYHGVERATFLIGPDGIVREVWRNVKVPGHVETVLEAVRREG